jgi:hypothetical protein
MTEMLYKEKRVFVNYKYELLRLKSWIFSELCLHTNHLRAEIYRERSGEYLPVSVMAKDESCKKYRFEILKGIKMFSFYKRVRFGPIHGSWQTSV